MQTERGNMAIYTFLFVAAIVGVGATGAPRNAEAGDVAAAGTPASCFNVGCAQRRGGATGAVATLACNMCCNPLYDGPDSASLRRGLPPCEAGCAALQRTEAQGLDMACRPCGPNQARDADGQCRAATAITAAHCQRMRGYCDSWCDQNIGTGDFDPEPGGSCFKGSCSPDARLARDAAVAAARSRVISRCKGGCNAAQQHCVASVARTGAYSSPTQVPSAWAP
jgi:hypothetical protein